MQAESIHDHPVIHLVARGRNGRRLFSYPRDYRAYILCLARAAVRTGCQIHAACLIPNQAELLLAYPGPDAIQALLDAANEPYTVLRNASRNASGSLFDRNMWSAPVAQSDQIGVTSAWIENTPVRSGAVIAAERYRWSTHAIAVGADAIEAWQKVWTPSRWYRALGENATARAAAYRSFFAGTAPPRVTGCAQ